MKIQLFLFSFLFILLGCTNSQQSQDTSVKNIILMIGDGMGVTQVYAAYTANNGKLNLEKAQAIGFSKTYSADDYITDSGAGGTAISSGVKTNNHMIGLSPDSLRVKTILELAEEANLSTGMVVTSSITHATPASFIAHQVSRNMQYAIASDFVGSDIDIFIGGGQTFFDDSLNISEKLRDENYSIVYSLEDIDTASPNNIGCLLAEEKMPKFSEGRGDYLPKATNIALSKLSKNDNGFFLMIEGSQIDWGGHDNDINYVIDETLDFDEAVGNAFSFADKNPGTLVIVTADHETGGLSIVDGNIATGEVIANFGSTDHTPVMVPVYAYGTAAHEFIGIYENTEIFHKMVKLLSLNP